MLLFINPSNMSGADKIIVPLNRVFDIFASGCSVNVNYDSGEFIEVNGNFEKKIETVRVVFDSVEDVNKIFRQFYKAVNQGSGAFFIGSEKQIEKQVEKKNS